jgi:hypothetical protein
MSEDLKVINTLRCYFFGISFDRGSNYNAAGLCGFAIPDLGILYKDRVRGSLFECQYNGLLALLRFIDTNINNLKGVDFEVLSDAAIVVYQLNNSHKVSRNLKELNEAALRFKSRLKYRISWIPRRENEALRGMLEAPAIEPEIEIRFNDTNSEDQTDHGIGNI